MANPPENQDGGRAGETGETHALLVPFVNVASRGGIYDDASYAAGWSMGETSYVLRVEQPDTHLATLRVADIEQAHAIADAFGYALDHEWSGMGEWAYCTFVRRTPTGPRLV